MIYQNLLETIIRYPVADVATLGSINTSTYSDGVIAVVQSLGKAFQLHKSSTETPDSVGVIGATGGGNWIQIKSRVFSSIPDEATMIALPATEGDIAFRSDTNSSFVKNNLITGTITDWVPLSENPIPTVNVQTASYIGQLSDNEGLVVFNNLTADSTFTIPENATAAIPVGGFIDVYNFSFYRVTPVLQGSDTSVFLSPITLLGSVRFKKISITGSISDWEMIFRSNIIPIVDAVTPPYSLQLTDIETIIDVVAPGQITVTGLPSPDTFTGIGGTVKNSSAGVVQVIGAGGATFEGQPEYDLMPGQAMFFVFDGISDFKVITQFVGTKNLLPPIDLTGSTSVTLTALHHGKIVSVGNGSAGTITVPQNSTQFLPIGYQTEIVNTGIEEFTFVPQGSDTIVNNQPLLRNNKCRIRKSAISGLISTFVIDSMDESDTVPDKLINISGTVTLLPSHSKVILVQTDAQTLLLPQPVAVNPGIWQGFRFTVKNTSGVTNTLQALTGTQIENSTTLSVPPRTAYEITVDNGNYYVIGAYQFTAPSSGNFIQNVSAKTLVYTVTPADIGTAFRPTPPFDLVLQLPAAASVPPNFYVIASSSSANVVTLSGLVDPIAGQGNVALPFGSGAIVYSDQTEWKLATANLHHLQCLAVIGTPFNLNNTLENQFLIFTVANPVLNVFGLGANIINVGYEQEGVNLSGTPLTLQGALGVLIDGFNSAIIPPGAKFKLRAVNNYPDGSNYTLVYTYNNQKVLYIPVDTDSDLAVSIGNNIRGRSIPLPGSFAFFNFSVPADFTALIKLEVLFWFGAITPDMYGVEVGFLTGNVPGGLFPGGGGSPSVNANLNSMASLDVTSITPALHANNVGVIAIAANAFDVPIFPAPGLQGVTAIRMTYR